MATTKIGNQEYGNRLYRYNIATDEWKKISICPGTPRAQCNLNIVDSKAYLIGGIATENKWKGKGQRFYHCFQYYQYYSINDSI